MLNAEGLWRRHTENPIYSEKKHIGKILLQRNLHRTLPSIVISSASEGSVLYWSRLWIPNWQWSSFVTTNAYVNTICVIGAARFSTNSQTAWVLSTSSALFNPYLEWRVARRGASRRDTTVGPGQCFSNKLLKFSVLPKGREIRRLKARNPGRGGNRRGWGTIRRGEKGEEQR